MQSLLPRLALAAWFAAVTAIGAATTALHEAVLPGPVAVGIPPAEGFRMTHALSAECRCSRRVLAYLLRRGAEPGVDERVVLVGGGEADRAALTGRGFAVELVDAATPDLPYPSVPSVTVHRPDGTVAYAGAYAPRPQMDPIDLGLLQRARRGDALEGLPIVGCAVSEALKARLDPLGLKYGGW